MRYLLLLALIVLFPSCASPDELSGAFSSPSGASVSDPRTVDEDVMDGIYDASIFFFSRSAGIATVEYESGLSFLTVPRLEIVRSPLSLFISDTGEPIFVSTKENINIKIYKDALLFAIGGRQEYAPWFFTSHPKDFYYNF